MRVDKITPSQRQKDVYYVDFEDDTSLRVGIAQIADFSLYAGRELTDEEYSQLKDSASQWNCMARAFRLAGGRSMSRKELIDKLTAKGEPQDMASYAADKLESLGIINDREYSFMIVSHYAEKGYGLGRVKNELYTRGVPRELWDDALDTFPDQTEILAELVNSRLKSSEPDKKELKKLTDFLLRRGFSWEEIRHALADRISED